MASSSGSPCGFGQHTEQNGELFEHLQCSGGRGADGTRERSLPLPDLAEMTWLREVSVLSSDLRSKSCLSTFAESH